MKKNYLGLLLLIGSSMFAQSNRDWATYYGNTGNDYGNCLAVDASGNIYIAGSTGSTTGIAYNGFQNTYGGATTDAFLLKLDAAGNRMWATYYGGTAIDGAYSIAVDASGNIYMTGTTTSSTNIAFGGFQNVNAGGGDAYLVKFDPNGNRLWATYYGGSGQEAGNGVTTDALGNVYLTGVTWSSSGIAYGGFQNSFGGGSTDAFVVKFDSAGVRLWASYYGGPGNDDGSSIVTDIAGSLYIAGTTRSISDIASGGFQSVFGGGNTDAFLVKLDSAGNRIWATYYGGTGEESGTDVAPDPTGNIYLTGNTTSTSDIATSGFQNVNGGGADAFLVKFDAAGNRIRGTYYGGSGGELGTAVSTDPSGNAYLAGRTTSIAGISDGGFQNSYGGGFNDGFLVTFSDSGTRICATYYGGTGNDMAEGITMDAIGNLYMVGQTNDTAAIASGGFQNIYGGGFADAFVVKFMSCAPTSVAENQLPVVNTVYPNPSSGKINIECEDGELCIYNMSGQIVHKQIVFRGITEIDIENEAPGLYFVEILYADKREYHKLILE